MYETIKELHIEIEQRIQQITSNRYGNIPPQFYDMMLNRTAIKYIQSKSNRKTNYKAEGLEDSMKRVEDFQSLKRETAWLPVIKYNDDPERGFVIIPSNYLKFISSTSKLQFKKNISESTIDKNDSRFKNVYYKVCDVENVTTENTTIKQVCGIDITSLYNMFENDVEFPKYAIELIYDKLNDNTDGIHYDVYYEYWNDRYYPQKFIITTNNPKNLKDFLNYTNECFIALVDDSDPPKVSPNFKYSENDLIASENVRTTLNDFYGNRNRHLNPITELINDKLYVYQDNDFCVSEIKITYLKKPKLFSFDLNQMSDMTITPEFVDMVVSDILLILKDNTFNYVKQQTNIE